MPLVIVASVVFLSGLFGWWCAGKMFKLTEPSVSPVPPEPLKIRDVDYRAVMLVAAGKLKPHVLWLCPCGKAVLWHGESVAAAPDVSPVCPECGRTVDWSLDDMFDVVES